jgi:hypothetical protein
VPSASVLAARRVAAGAACEATCMTWSGETPVWTGSPGTSPMPTTSFPRIRRVPSRERPDR